MTAEDDLLERAGQLKGELVDFAERVPQIAKELRVALTNRLNETRRSDESGLIDVIDRFVLHHELRDGRSVLEHFVSGRPDLTQSEREMMLAWSDDIEGVFLVVDRAGDRLDARNLIDELTYRIRSNAGAVGLTGVATGDYLVGRVVPVGDVWMLSGAQARFPASERAHLVRAAAEAVMRQPRLVLRNPAKLARAWELQRQDRELFVEFFGSDLMVFSGCRVHEEWTRYWAWRVTQAQGAPAADSARQPEASPRFDLPEEFADAETVAAIYDETEGLTFLVEFGVVEAAFADPAMASSVVHRRTVLSYLNDSTVTALPFRRLAAQYPAGANQLLARLLSKPRFDWARDGEKLLRRYKPGATTEDPLPTITVLSDELAHALRAG